MTQSLAGRLTPDGHALDLRVYFEDTDFSGVVYHARYLHFLERGRTDFLRLKGIGHRELFEGGFGPSMAFAVRSMAIDFLRSARIDEVLTVTTRMHRVAGARLELDQTIAREAAVLVTARVTVAVISAEGRPMRLPKPILAALGPSLETDPAQRADG